MNHDPEDTIGKAVLQTTFNPRVIKKFRYCSVQWNLEHFGKNLIAQGRGLPPHPEVGSEGLQPEHCAGQSFHLPIQNGPYIRHSKLQRQVSAVLPLSTTTAATCSFDAVVMLAGIWRLKPLSAFSPLRYSFCDRGLYKEKTMITRGSGRMANF